MPTIQSLTHYQGNNYIESYSITTYVKIAHSIEAKSANIAQHGPRHVQKIKQLPSPHQIRLFPLFNNLISLFQNPISDFSLAKTSFSCLSESIIYTECLWINQKFWSDGPQYPEDNES